MKKDRREIWVIFLGAGGGGKRKDLFSWSHDSVLQWFSRLCLVSEVHNICMQQSGSYRWTAFSCFFVSSDFITCGKLAFLEKKDCTSKQR